MILSSPKFLPPSPMTWWRKDLNINLGRTQRLDMMTCLVSINIIKAENKEGGKSTEELKSGWIFIYCAILIYILCNH